MGCAFPKGPAGLCYIYTVYVHRRLTPGVSAVTWVTQSDWPMDPSLPKKLNNSQRFDAGNGADGTD